MFDFDDIPDRSNSDSLKWRRYGDRDVIPMWVADMDFKSPPEVIRALRLRVDHGVFGYALPDDKLKEVIIADLEERHRWSVDPNWIVWLPGLVTGLNVACRAVGRPGAGVVTSVPIYPPFLSAPTHWGKRPVTFPFTLSNNRWRMDLEAFEQSIDERTALFLLCNPHNPTGRALTRHELEAITEICLRHGLVICSDEIHCDLVLSKTRRHIPTATIDPEVAERTITLMAPSKTYNVPGLGCAFAIISNSSLRRKFEKAMTGIVPHVNLFGFAAALAAYEHGRSWLDELITYLRANAELVHRSINRIPGLDMAPVEATYLAWIDARESGVDEPTAFFERAGVGLSDGVLFGAPGFVRLNFGCPRGVLEAALKRISLAI